MPLNVTVVNYSVALEKEVTAEGKMLTHTGHPPEEVES